jgi:hypothetical protein
MLQQIALAVPSWTTGHIILNHIIRFRSGEASHHLHSSINDVFNFTCQEGAVDKDLGSGVDARCLICRPRIELWHGKGWGMGHRVPIVENRPNVLLVIPNCTVERSSRGSWECFEKLVFIRC